MISNAPSKGIRLHFEIAASLIYSLSLCISRYRSVYFLKFRLFGHPGIEPKDGVTEAAQSFSEHMDLLLDDRAKREIGAIRREINEIS